LKWQKDNALQIAHDYVVRKNYEIQQVVTKQITEMFRQYNSVRDEAMVSKNEVERVTLKLVGYEARITQLTLTVNSFHAKNTSEANFIKFINEDQVQNKPD